MKLNCEACKEEFDWEQSKPSWQKPKLCKNCRYGLEGHKKMAKPRPIRVIK